MADDIKKIPVVSAQTKDDAANLPLPTDPQFDDIKKELITRFTLLPEDIQKAIIDEGYQTKLFNLAKEQKMTYEELGMMETETTMVLLGMTRPEEFRDELQLQLKKNDADMDVLVQKINEQVFAPIRASLERVYAAKKEPSSYIPESIVTGVVENDTNTPPQGSLLGKGGEASPSLSQEDKTVLEKTGVVINEPPVPSIPIEPSQISDRKDILKDIENPRKTSSLGLVADKLSKSGPVMPTKSTDYSILKNTQPPTTGNQSVQAKPSTDPYRESIS